MPDLDYHKLACPRCGNREAFVEIALRPTSQPFTVKPGEEPEWDLWESCDSEECIPQEVLCAKCREVESDIVVWDDVNGYNTDPER